MEDDNDGMKDNGLILILIVVIIVIIDCLYIIVFVGLL